MPQEYGRPLTAPPEFLGPTDWLDHLGDTLQTENKGTGQVVLTRVSAAKSVTHGQFTRQPDAMRSHR